MVLKGIVTDRYRNYTVQKRTVTVLYRIIAAYRYRNVP